MITPNDETECHVDDDADADEALAWRPPDLAAVAAAHARGRVSRIECRMCGYEPCDQHQEPRRRCPKCQSTTWERVVRTSLRGNTGQRWGHRPNTVMPRPPLRCALPYS